MSEVDPYRVTAWQELAAERDRLRAEVERLTQDLDDTKALIPNKLENGCMVRPMENANWWAVAVLERRGRKAAEKRVDELQRALALAKAKQPI